MFYLGFVIARLGGNGRGEGKGRTLRYKNMESTNYITFKNSRSSFFYKPARAVIAIGIHSFQGQSREYTDFTLRNFCRKRCTLSFRWCSVSEHSLSTKRLSFWEVSTVKNFVKVWLHSTTKRIRQLCRWEKGGVTSHVWVNDSNYAIN